MNRLIDGIANLNSVLGDKYEGVKRLDVMKRSKFEDRVPKTQATVESFALTNWIVKEEFRE